MSERARLRPPAPPDREAPPALDFEAWTDTDLSGTVLEQRLRLIRPLGAGGMGTVYLAEHLLLGGLVAIKILDPRFAWDREWVQRFLVEAQATRKIGHENIVQIHDLCILDRGRVFMVMEYVEGESLADLCERVGPLPWRRALQLVDQIAAALEAAHARGIVHRDVKPSNCLCRPDDTIKVLDFGIAKILDPASHGIAAPRTSTDVWMGTAEFMAPEQFRGEPADARVDVYALGALLVKLLTGRTPYLGTHLEVATQMLHGRAPRASEVAPLDVLIPLAVDEMLVRALAHAPDRRTPSMTALRRDIAAALADEDVALEPTVLFPLPPTLLASSTPPANGDRPVPPLPVAPARPTGPGRRSLLLAALSCALTLSGGSWAMFRAAPSDPATTEPTREPVAQRNPLVPAPPTPAPAPTAAPVPQAISTPPVTPVPQDISTLAAAPVPQDTSEPAAPATQSLSTATAAPVPRDIPKSAPAPTLATAAPRLASRTETEAPRPRSKRRDLLSAPYLRQRLDALQSRLSKHCFARQDIAPGTRLPGQLQVDRDGRAELTLGGPQLPNLRACIHRRVTALWFPASAEGGRLDYVFYAAPAAR